MIKTILANLDPADRAILMENFNEVIKYVFDLKGNKFIAVHGTPDRPHKVLESNTFWTYGEYV